MIYKFQQGKNFPSKKIIEIEEIFEDEQPLEESPLMEIKQKDEYINLDTSPQQLTLRPNRDKATYNPDMLWLNNWYKGRNQVLDENISSWKNLRSYTNELMESPNFNKDTSFKRRVLGLRAMYGMPDFYNKEILHQSGDSTPFDYTDESYYGFNQENGLLTNDDYKNALFNNLNTVKIGLSNSDQRTGLGLSNTTGGVYNGLTHGISLFPLSKEYYQGKKDFDNSILIHEGTHATNFTPALAKIQKYFIDNYSKLKHRNDNYWDSANEIYSRLMQFRHEHNLKPTDVITKERLQQLKKNTVNTDNFVDRYDDDTLLFFLNDVAQNNNNLNQDVYFSKLGGLLTKKGES